MLIILNYATWDFLTPKCIFYRMRDYMENRFVTRVGDFLDFSLKINTSLPNLEDFCFLLQGHILYFPDLPGSPLIFKKSKLADLVNNVAAAEKQTVGDSVGYIPANTASVSHTQLHTLATECDSQPVRSGLHPYGTLQNKTLPPQDSTTSSGGGGESHAQDQFPH